MLSYLFVLYRTLFNSTSYSTQFFLRYNFLSYPELGKIDHVFLSFIILNIAKLYKLFINGAINTPIAEEDYCPKKKS